jgi:hypothetical protein
MERQIQQTLFSFQSRHLDGIYAENWEEATLKILQLIPLGAIVGTGDSTTVSQLGVLRALKKRGTVVLNPFETEARQINDQMSLAWSKEIAEKATVCDVFLTGTNAVTLDGRLVNVDHVGNRVAGMVWGHPISVIVIGRNKIVKDLDEAFFRIRKMIAPYHLRVRSRELGGRDLETPCIGTGECNDCRTVDRGCNIFTIIEGKPLFTDLKVILVDDDLGLGWDNSWPQSRIKRITENYKKFVWVPEKTS